MIPAVIERELPCECPQVIASPGQDDVLARCGECWTCAAIADLQRAARSQALEDAASLCDEKAKTFDRAGVMESIAGAIAEDRAAVACEALAAEIRGKKYSTA